MQPISVVDGEPLPACPGELTKADEAWKKLEPSLGELEQKLGQATDATKAKAQDLLKRFAELRDRVKKQPAKK